MSFPFDATLKELVRQSPDDFRGAFRLPELGPIVSLNIDLATISAATDVALGFGDPLQEIVDLNFQSGFDSAVAARLHLYNAALHLRYGIPVQSVLVLMRPKADERRINGKLTYISGGKRITFQYHVVRLWREPADAFLHGGI